MVLTICLCIYTLGNEKFSHVFSLHPQNFQFQSKYFDEILKYWLSILAGCKYKFCGPAKSHLQLCPVYVWLAKWVMMAHKGFYEKLIIIELQAT